MKPGIYTGISNADYHSGPGISKSGLDLIKSRSPAHYIYEKNKERGEESAAFLLGTALHCAVLEPQEFAKNYCLELRRQDVPEAIDDKDTLIAMVNILNDGRLPKISTGGSKAEQVDRILENKITNLTAEELGTFKGADLKAVIELANQSRQGLLSTSGTRHQLAEILRENGTPVTLWSDVLEEWKASNGDKITLSEVEWQKVSRMREEIEKHPTARKLLREANNVVVDLKTTENAGLEEFSRSIAKYGYDVQHPFYLDGIKHALEQSGQDAPAEGLAEASVYWNDPETGVLCRCRPDHWRGQPKHFVFIAVEKSEPHAVAVYALDEESASIGRVIYRHALELYSECLQTDTWPAYSDKVETIKVPAWHAKRNNELLGSNE